MQDLTVIEWMFLYLENILKNKSSLKQNKI
jgi:hypothetical protein